MSLPTLPIPLDSPVDRRSACLAESCTGKFGCGCPIGTYCGDELQARYARYNSLCDATTTSTSNAPAPSPTLCLDPVRRLSKRAHSQCRCTAAKCNPRDCFNLSGVSQESCCDVFKNNCVKHHYGITRAQCTTEYESCKRKGSYRPYIVAGDCAAWVKAIEGV